MQKKMELKRVTRRNYDHFFESQDFHQGEYCTYQFEWFLWMTIQELAEKAGMVIKYCSPGSYGYKTYGDSTFRVFPLDDFYGVERDHPEAEVQQVDIPVHIFDPEMLVI